MNFLTKALLCLLCELLFDKQKAIFLLFFKTRFANVVCGKNVKNPAKFYHTTEANCTTCLMICEMVKKKEKTKFNFFFEIEKFLICETTYFED